MIFISILSKQENQFLFGVIPADDIIPTETKIVKTKRTIDIAIFYLNRSNGHRFQSSVCHPFTYLHFLRRGQIAGYTDRTGNKVKIVKINILWWYKRRKSRHPLPELSKPRECKNEHWMMLELKRDWNIDIFYNVSYNWVSVYWFAYIFKYIIDGEIWMMSFYLVLNFHSSAVYYKTKQGIPYLNKFTFTSFLVSFYFPLLSWRNLFTFSLFSHNFLSFYSSRFK